MNIHTFCNNTFTESYISLLKDLMIQGSEKSPRGQKVKYFQNSIFHIEYPGDVFSCEYRKYNWDYLNKELMLYFKGELDVDKFAEASKFWKKLANPDLTINSNYGYLVFYKPIETKFGTIKNQWTYAKNQLINDKDSRQAIMFISSPHVQFEGNKDFICTLNYTFNINDDVLSLTVNRRSQDVILGIVYDYAWEYLLLLKMHNELKEYYPNLKLGSYTMFCNNIHAYERNWEMINNMIEEYDKYPLICREYMSSPFTIDEFIINEFVMNKEFGNK